MFVYGNCIPLEEGFGFVIRGKYLKGDVPKQAYYMRHTSEVYGPDKEDGYYPIDDDAYYAVVVVAHGKDDADENMPRPRFSMQPPSLTMSDGMLFKGDLKILQLP